MTASSVEAEFSTPVDHEYAYPTVLQYIHPAIYSDQAYYYYCIKQLTQHDTSKKKVKMRNRSRKWSIEIIPESMINSSVVLFFPSVRKDRQ